MKARQVTAPVEPQDNLQPSSDGKERVGEVHQGSKSASLFT
jgi:hypothetical protein